MLILPGSEDIFLSLFMQMFVMFSVCVCVGKSVVEGGGRSNVKGDVQHQIARLINLSVRLFTVTINSVPQGAY